MSGLIPKHFIVDLVDRADVVEVVGRRVQLKKAGKEFKACCPFHDEKTPSFTVSPAKGFYHCFGCGAHGNALDFLMEYEHMEFVEAVESLAQAMGVEVPREEGQRPARRYDELFEIVAAVDRYFQKELANNEVAKNYLKQRGIDGATAKRFGIGYAPDGWTQVTDKFGTSKDQLDRLLATGLVIRKDNGRHYDRFRERIMFPIRDGRGRTIAFGGRVIGDGNPKYMNSPETALFHKGRELYGLYEARQALRSIERLVVVEGYMDAVALARNGIEFVVATLGTATTEEHLNRLFRICDEVVFCFDGDRAGREAAWRALDNALPQIRDGRQIRFAFLPEGQDPDSFVRASGADGFMAELEQAKPLSAFLLDGLAEQVDMASVDGRSRMVELGKPLLDKIPAGAYKELLKNELARLVGLDRKQIDTLVDRPGRANGRDRNARPSTRLRPQAGGKLTIVRQAIKLLVHFPQAAVDADASRLDSLDRPGAELLRALIETVQKEPNITAAGLIERFREDTEGQHLGNLAAVELPDLDEFDPGAELAGCIDRLAQIAVHDRADFLIEKQRRGELTADDRVELRRLTQGPAANA